MIWKKRLARVMAAGLLVSVCFGYISQPAAAAPVIANMPHKADGTRITGSQPVPKTMPKDAVVKTKVKSTPGAQATAKTEAPGPVTSKSVTQAAQPAKEISKPKATTTHAATKTEVPKPKAETAQVTPKPAAPSAQTAPKTQAPKAATPKPVTPVTQTAKPVIPKPVTPATQTAQKTEVPKPKAETAQATPKPAVPSVQTAPKTEAPKAATPKPVTPVTQTVQKTEAAKPATQKPAVKTAPATLPTKPPGWRVPKPATGTDAAVTKKPKAQKETKKEPEKSVYKVGDKGWKVKQAQLYLQKLGIDPDETDGRFTKSTRKAIRKFQKKYKLKETGNLDNATWQELKWQVEAKEYGGNVASTKILKTAARYKGVPYVFGGTTPKGFDCSGYVQFVFAKHGVRLTRTADTQALEGKFVSRKSLRPGDLVFFTTYEPGASHVGIYAGNNQFWNATSSRGIMLSNLNDSYWGPRYYTARRILSNN